jgi:hypothetical protein
MGQTTSVVEKGNSTQTLSSLLRSLDDNPSNANVFFASILSINEARALFNDQRMENVGVRECLPLYAGALRIMERACVDTPEDRLQLLVCCQCVASVTMSLFDRYPEEELAKCFLSGQPLCVDCGMQLQRSWIRCPYCTSSQMLSPNAQDPLIVRLFCALSNLLYCSGFTVSSSHVAGAPWGLLDRVPYQSMIDARYHVLHTMLVLLSLPLRVPVTEQRVLSRTRLWQQHLEVSVGDERCRAIFSSLLNFGLLINRKVQWLLV